MDNRLLEELEASFGEELALVGDDLGALEAAAQEKLRQLGRGLLQRLLDRRSHGYQGSSIACPCGKGKRFVEYRSREVHTLFGWVQVRRAYYHCRDCGKGVSPYDKTSGLGQEQLSPALARACCLLTVDDSFAETSRKVTELFGQEVSANTVERLAHQVGSRIVRRQEQEMTELLRLREPPAAEVEPQRLYVTTDGTTVHEADGWHEAKLGAVYWDDPQGKRQTRYLGGFVNSETLGWHLWRTACECGLRQASEVVFLGDGAHWIRKEQQRHFSRATFIVDWYHASQHIWECGKTLFGEGADKTARWSRMREGWLWEGDASRLLKDLSRQIKGGSSVKRKALEDLHRYVKENECSMRYDVFRAKGFDIGSGVIEGACKHVAGKRLKQSGMIWSRRGSEAVLALRLAWLNQEWDDLWSRKPLAA
jgi:hypothetical protein